ncbi:MAG: hypothetical protein AAB524_02220, partial [Patescibacteria group bacterium]
GVELIHHLVVVVEDLKGQIQLVGEGVVVANDRLDRLAELPDKVDAIRDDVEVIKITLGTIKNDLKQKVDRDEFVTLEKRVSMLEVRLNRSTPA